MVGRAKSLARAGHVVGQCGAAVALLQAAVVAVMQRSTAAGVGGSGQTGVAGGAARTDAGWSSAVGVEGGRVGRTVAAEVE